jgi:hypothetical protein
VLQFRVLQNNERGFPLIFTITVVEMALMTFELGGIFMVLPLL